MASVRDAAMIDADKLHLVDGKHYDLRTFVHPGGLHVLQQSRGEDITALVRSHHFSDAPYRVMERYFVHRRQVNGQISNGNPYTFKEEGFYETVKRRVVALLGKPGLRAEVGFMYKAKVAITLVACLVTWLYCCFCPLWWPAMLAHLVMRQVATGIGHEAIHGRLPFLKHLMDWTFLLPVDKWHDDHCLRHHPHCKREDKDPDEILPLCRLSEKTPWAKHHAAHVLTQVLLSFLMGPGNVIAQRIVEPLLAGTFDPVDLVWSIFILVTSQLLPMMTHPDGFYAGLLVHFSVVMMGNCIVLHTFHLSHINEACSSVQYEHVDGVDWGEHQLRTTCNFISPDFPAFSWPSSGMLEYQIEHHLFPSLLYSQQREIQDTVRRTAKEFNIPYYEYSSLFHGMWSHMSYMHILSHEVQPVEAKSPDRLSWPSVGGVTCLSAVAPCTLVA